MGRNPRRLFLVYVAAILRYEPIFTQLLSFIFRSAGAVEQLAVQRAIGVTNFWHTVLILKLGLSQILCKRRNAVQIEQNLFKAEVAQAAAALFSK